MQKIIFDTDIGVDDAFALTYAAQSVDIIGITTVFGNVPVAQAVSNARLCSHKIGLNVPVYRGCSRPLVHPPTPPACAIHGEDGFGDVFDNPWNGAAGNAVDFIINSVRNNPDALTLVAVGPLTNIALAINQAPDIVPQIKQLVMMGGAFGTHGHGGNITPFAEWNTWRDPHAADQVLNSTLPVVMIPLDVTLQVLVHGDEIRALNQPVLEAISRRYLQYNCENDGIAAIALHDTLTIAWLNHPEWFSVSESLVHVVTDGISRGQTLRHPASRQNPFSTRLVKKLCLMVESQRVKQHFLNALQR
ncbi:nucleoside hydrolase [Erwinia amylovora]|uniref:Nucleoside hydrolase n=4 Tax=Erwinia amylovora TaxID=552 RepID=A0ABX7MHI2_ERWAM|nr:nucleoside hydrolase [Erwinia amylovora]CBX82478.1 putative nucleoside hydrolase [Erwinia amylovora ATCC BAA-2158]CDK16871.1 putative nucleoside hydrolase [Erwinia amylovora LA635]CDK20239.1 putative nucleoside hydrolase [Erwinia amylovora LA636]CDK23610.1 putative nucleoside hydrolase [Erwinia amylovora LA637]ATZ13088.1 nucleoside hydrolase [Erwinia amylovora]